MFDDYTGFPGRKGTRSPRESRHFKVVVDSHASDRLYPHTGGIMEGLEAIFRWMHVFTGIIWIGHLYFFNWVNGPSGGET